jgi:hypothetical protein
MKRILFLLSICLGGLVNAQTSYKIASIEGKPNIINQEDYDFVQKIITQKPIHIHTDSKGHLFTICWNGPETIYTIIGPKGEKIKSGKIDGNIKIKTKRWKSGIYTLKIDKNTEFIMLMKKQKL